MLSRLSFVIGTSCKRGIGCCNFRIRRTHRQLSSTPNKKHDEKLQSSIEENSEESGDYLGVSGDHVDGANFGIEEILANQTKEELSRTYGLGKYTTSNAYDGKLMVTNFGEIKIDAVRKGVIPSKKDFSKLKPKLGYIADTLINYREKVDHKISPIPVSRLRGHELNERENASAVSEEKNVLLDNEHISDDSISYSTKSATSSPCSDNVNKTSVEKTRQIKPLLDIPPKLDETKQNSCKAKLDLGTEPSDTLGNEESFVSEVKMSTTQSPDIEKKHQPIKNGHKLMQKSMSVNDDEKNSVNVAMGKRNVKVPEILIMEVVSEKEMNNIPVLRSAGNTLTKSKTNTTFTHQQAEPSSTGNDRKNYAQEDNISLIHGKKREKSSHRLQNLVDLHLNEERSVINQEGMKRDFVKEMLSGDDMKLKTPYVEDGAINSIQDTQNKSMEVDRNKELKPTTMKSSSKLDKGKEESSHNLEKMLDSSLTEDRYDYQDGMKDDFSKELSLDDDMRSKAPYVENAALKYFQDIVKKDQGKEIDKTSEVDLSKFVPKNVYKLTEEEVVDELMESILYNKDDILAINKIYGIPSQGGEGVRYNIADLLPKLAERIHCEKLHMVHRLDKETTGVMLFGKTEEMAKKLRGAFKQREVKKTYLVITKGIPKLKEGIINVPIAECEVGKDQRRRMTCIPIYNSETKHVMQKSKKNSVKAVTHYKVVANSNSCALVEVSPETGVKHQIRTHLLHVLNTPILGDHKYSYLTEIKPQILPSDVIRRLGIRQSKARNLPMYIHAKELLIPGLLDGSTFSVHCSVPRAFRSFLKKAKISAKNVKKIDYVGSGSVKKEL